MSQSNSLLFRLIDEDFGLEGHDKWWRSREHSSLVYDAENDLFYFNAQDVNGDAYIYLTKVRGYTHQEAKEYIRANGSDAVFISVIRNKEEVTVYPKLVEVFHQNLLNSEDREYFYRRTITDETISRFQLGKYNDWYTVPIYMDGILKQIQLRRDDPKTIRGYYKNIGGYLFNSDILKLTNKIIIVEGLTSCLVLNQNGVPAIAPNSATGFQEEYFKYFIHQKEIIILFDRDSAGDNGAIRTAQILGENRCKIYNFWDYDEPGYDANDWFKDGGNIQELLYTIDNKSKFAFEMDNYKEYNEGRFRKNKHRF